MSAFSASASWVRPAAERKRLTFLPNSFRDRPGTGRILSDSNYLTPKDASCFSSKPDRNHPAPPGARRHHPGENLRPAGIPRVNFDPLQLIQDIGITAEEYVAEDFHARISPPMSCPHCGASKMFWALGYYVRNLTVARAGFVRITIRRFRCCRCRKTVSVLPAFAQPYRLVQNGTIEKFAAGKYDQEVVRWIELLRRYWARFVIWLPELRRVVWDDEERGPPDDDAADWWISLVSQHGNFAAATMASVSLFRITFFGRYRCHQPFHPGVCPS